MRNNTRRSRLRTLGRSSTAAAAAGGNNTSMTNLNASSSTIATPTTTTTSTTATTTDDYAPKTPRRSTSSDQLVLTTPRKATTTTTTTTTTSTDDTNVATTTTKQEEQEKENNTNTNTNTNTNNSTHASSNTVQQQQDNHLPTSPTTTTATTATSHPTTTTRKVVSPILPTTPRQKKEPLSRWAYAPTRETNKSPKKGPKPIVTVKQPTTTAKIRPSLPLPPPISSPTKRTKSKPPIQQPSQNQNHANTNEPNTENTLTTPPPPPTTTTKQEEQILQTKQLQQTTNNDDSGTIAMDDKKDDGKQEQKTNKHDQPNGKDDDDDDEEEEEENHDTDDEQKQQQQQQQHISSSCPTHPNNPTVNDEEHKNDDTTTTTTLSNLSRNNNNNNQNHENKKDNPTTAVSPPSLPSRSRSGDRIERPSRTKDDINTKENQEQHNHSSSSNSSSSSTCPNEQQQFISSSPKECTTNEQDNDDDTTSSNNNNDSKNEKNKDKTTTSITTPPSLPSRSKSGDMDIQAYARPSRTTTDNREKEKEPNPSPCQDRTAIPNETSTSTSHAPTLPLRSRSGISFSPISDTKKDHENDNQSVASNSSSVSISFTDVFQNSTTNNIDAASATTGTTTTKQTQKSSKQETQKINKAPTKDTRNHHHSMSYLPTINNNNNTPINNNNNDTRFASGVAAEGKDLNRSFSRLSAQRNIAPATKRHNNHNQKLLYHLHHSLTYIYNESDDVKNDSDNNNNNNQKRIHPPPPPPATKDSLPSRPTSRRPLAAAAPLSPSSVASGTSTLSSHSTLRNTSSNSRRSNLSPNKSATMSRFRSRPFIENNAMHRQKSLPNLLLSPSRRELVALEEEEDPEHESIPNFNSNNNNNNSTSLDHLVLPFASHTKDASSSSAAASVRRQIRKEKNRTVSPSLNMDPKRTSSSSSSSSRKPSQNRDLVIENQIKHRFHNNKQEKKSNYEGEDESLVHGGSSNSSNNNSHGNNHSQRFNDSGGANRLRRRIQNTKSQILPRATHTTTTTTMRRAMSAPKRNNKANKNENDLYNNNSSEHGNHRFEMKRSVLAGYGKSASVRDIVRKRGEKSSTTSPPKAVLVPPTTRIPQKDPLLSRSDHGAPFFITVPHSGGGRTGGEEDPYSRLSSSVRDMRFHSNDMFVTVPPPPPPPPGIITTPGSNSRKRTVRNYVTATREETNNRRILSPSKSMSNPLRRNRDVRDVVVEGEGSRRPVLSSAKSFSSGIIGSTITIRKGEAESDNNSRPILAASGRSSSIKDIRKEMQQENACMILAASGKSPSIRDIRKEMEGKVERRKSLSKHDRSLSSLDLQKENEIKQFHSSFDTATSSPIMMDTKQQLQDTHAGGILAASGKSPSIRDIRKGMEVNVERRMSLSGHRRGSLSGLDVQKENEIKQYHAVETISTLPLNDTNEDTNLDPPGRDKRMILAASGKSPSIRDIRKGMEMKVERRKSLSTHSRRLSLSSHGKSLSSIDQEIENEIKNSYSDASEIENSETETNAEEDDIDSFEGGESVENDDRKEVHSSSIPTRKADERFAGRGRAQVNMRAILKKSSSLRNVRKGLGAKSSSMRDLGQDFGRRQLHAAKSMRDLRRDVGNVGKRQVHAARSFSAHRKSLPSRDFQEENETKEEPRVEISSIGGRQKRDDELRCSDHSRKSLLSNRENSRQRRKEADIESRSIDTAESGREDRVGRKPPARQHSYSSHKRTSPNSHRKQGSEIDRISMEASSISSYGEGNMQTEETREVGNESETDRKEEEESADLLESPSSLVKSEEGEEIGETSHSYGSMRSSSSRDNSKLRTYSIDNVSESSSRRECSTQKSEATDTSVNEQEPEQERLLKSSSITDSGEESKSSSSSSVLEKGNILVSSSIVTSEDDQARIPSSSIDSKEGGLLSSVNSSLLSRRNEVGSGENDITVADEETHEQKLTEHSYRGSTGGVQTENGIVGVSGNSINEVQKENMASVESEKEEIGVTRDDVAEDGVDFTRVPPVSFTAPIVEGTGSAYHGSRSLTDAHHNSSQIDGRCNDNGDSHTIDEDTIETVKHNTRQNNASYLKDIETELEGEGSESSLERNGGRVDRDNSNVPNNDVDSLRAKYNDGDVEYDKSRTLFEIFHPIDMHDVPSLSEIGNSYQSLSERDATVPSLSEIGNSYNSLSEKDVAHENHRMPSMPSLRTIEDFDNDRLQSMQSMPSLREIQEHSVADMEHAIPGIDDAPTNVSRREQFSHLRKEVSDSEFSNLNEEVNPDAVDSDMVEFETSGFWEPEEEDVFSYYCWSTYKQEGFKILEERKRMKDIIRRSAIYSVYKYIGKD